LPASRPGPNWKTAIARGFRKKCPQCGRGELFRRFNILHERCPDCGLKYLEEQGALFGYLFLVDRALFLFPLIVMIYFRLYIPHAAWLFYLSFAAVLFALFYTLPRRSGVSVALHYLRRRRSGSL